MSKTPTPSWVADSLIAAGVMTTDRVTRHAKTRRCHDCGRTVLVALDEILANRNLELDPQPITAAGEAVAILTGRATYELDGDLPFQRSPRRIRYKPAADAAVFADHACHHPALPMNTTFAPPAPADPNSSHIPF